MFLRLLKECDFSSILLGKMDFFSTISKGIFFHNTKAFLQSLPCLRELRQWWFIIRVTIGSSLPRRVKVIPGAPLLLALPFTFKSIPVRMISYMSSNYKEISKGFRGMEIWVQVLSPLLTGCIL